ncbi:MAG: heat-inducible transcription repressor HrcA [Clostridia bacterium]|nr:heat-inducible transcription repressor HrcA [Clostridia bacterium]MBO7288461.1 heat-inducible transcription repressor HrcA [Clostridia bacterium]
MELSERKKKILQAIIDDYIVTAEPVGSSHILKSHNLGISSATVRNEMASLEEGGYLEKPHTSAGRVPSYLGYRVYVDELMNEYRLSVSEISQITNAFRQRYAELSKTIEGISNAISGLTNYTTLYTTPASCGTIIKSFKLIPIDEKSFVMIVVMDDGSVKNRTIRVKSEFDSGVLEKLSNYLNYRFSNINSSILTPETLEGEKQLVPIESGMLDSIFGFLADIANSDNSGDLLLTGTTNIFNHPEFSSIDRTREFLEFVKKDNIGKLKELISATGDSTSVIIGNENPVLKDKDISLVVSNYSLGGGVKGKLAIIGPTRMDYARVISTLDYLTGCINEAISKEGEQID